MQKYDFNIIYKLALDNPYLFQLKLINTIKEAWLMNEKSINDLTFELSEIIEKVLKELHASREKLTKETLSARLNENDKFSKVLSEAFSDKNTMNKTEFLKYIAPLKGYINNKDMAVVEKSIKDKSTRCRDAALELVSVLSKHIYTQEKRLSVITIFIEELFSKFGFLQQTLTENHGTSLSFLNTDVENDKVLLDSAKNLQDIVNTEDNIVNLQERLVSSIDEMVADIDVKLVNKTQKIADIADSYGALENKLQEYKSEVDNLKSEMKRYQLESITDHLTEVYNRKYLDLKLKEEIERHTRIKTPFSIILTDIDDFKKVNDTYGHLVGDQVLVHISKTLQKLIRKSDFVFRYGGEEFIVLLINSDSKSASEIAEQIRKSIESTNFSVGEKSFNVTSSFGVAEYAEGENDQEFLNRADKHMYNAKNSGKNKVVSD